jgi:hypothetical protein
MPKAENMTKFVSHGRDPVVVRVTRLRLKIEARTMAPRLVVAPRSGYVASDRPCLYIRCGADTYYSEIVGCSSIPVLGALAVAVGIDAIAKCILEECQSMLVSLPRIADLVMPELPACLNIEFKV